MHSTETVVDTLMENQHVLAQIFERHSVELAYLFGSQARGDAGSLSDVDIAVLFSQDLSTKERFEHLLQLSGELGSLFQRDDVFIVDLGDASPLLRHRVYYEGEVLYCVSENVRVHFEITTLRDYVDTKPLRAIKQKYVLQRFSSKESAG
jgi:predicted nucleotidyltransferase